MDRVGFGRTPRDTDGPAGWPVDHGGVVDVLESVGPAHVVGHSYGAVVALLVAGRRPELIRSLVVIEPLLFDIAARQRTVKPVMDAFRGVFTRARSMTASEFRIAFRVATGSAQPSEADAAPSLTEADWRAIDNSRFEAWPGDAPIDFAAIAAATWPKVVVVGTAPVVSSREPTRAAFRATARAVARRIDGSIVEFHGSGHGPQVDEPDRFNLLMRDVWREA